MKKKTTGILQILANYTLAIPCYTLAIPCYTLAIPATHTRHTYPLHLTRRRANCGDRTHDHKLKGLRSTD